MNSLTPEQKAQRIQTVVKVVGLGLLLLVLGPVYITMLHGMMALAALGITAGVSFVVINLIPAFARMVGNWRLKALKAVAALNPIESLEIIYRDKQAALAASLDNINQTLGILRGIYDQIQQHDEQFPGKPSQYLEMYNNLKALIEMRGRKYKIAAANLSQFADKIEEKRSEWKIAQAMAQAKKLANVGEDFESKLMQDTALSTVRDGLNDAFAQLDTALLVEAPTADAATVTVSSPKQVSNSTVSMPDLDLGTTQDAEVVPVKASRRSR